jgi:uncharacterized protein DUF6088
MGRARHKTGAAATMRRRIQAAPDRFLTYANFRDLPPSAVAQTLSRLTRDGEIERVGKGLYYVPRQTVFGSSVPTGPDIAAHTALGTLHPAGVSAANVLGLTTQNSTGGEFATTRASQPKALAKSRVLTGRDRSRDALTQEEGALLEVLRDAVRTADLNFDAISRRLARVIREDGAFRRLRTAALREPPRVRAMLGALAQEAGIPSKQLELLRRSLSPYSRYEFGRLSELRHAGDWQAR